MCRRGGLEEVQEEWADLPVACGDREKVCEARQWTCSSLSLTKVRLISTFRTLPAAIMNIVVVKDDGKGSNVLVDADQCVNFKVLGLSATLFPCVNKGRANHESLEEFIILENRAVSEGARVVADSAICRNREEESWSNQPFWVTILKQKRRGLAVASCHQQHLISSRICVKSQRHCLRGDC